MSSRNAYFSYDQREAAAALPRAMRAAIAAMKAGGAIAAALEDLRAALLEAGFDSVDYAEVRSSADLKPSAQAGPADRLFVAARIGGTRLIDNMAIG
jgi:pantoate--beta-alanine ligase